MVNNQSSGEVAIDRREKILKTEQPGYQSTQHVTEDAAGSRRLQLIQITRIMLLVLGLLEMMLGLRFILKLMAANPVNGFAGFIYGLTGTFTGPFDALLGPPAIDGSIFETTTLIAMAAYAMLFGLAGRLLLLIGDRPRARTSAQAVETQTTGIPAVIRVDRIDRADPPPVLRAVKLPGAYDKFIRRRQRWIPSQARANARSTIAGGPDSINVEQTPVQAGLDSTDRATLAESINVEQPAQASLDRIDRATLAESINVEQTPARAIFDRTDRSTLAESINVEQTPADVNPVQADPLLQSYSEFVQRHRQSTGSLEPKIPLDNMN